MHSKGLWGFFDKFEPGMKYDGTALTTQGFQPLACNLAQWCTVPLSRLIIEMAMLGPFLRVPSNFEIFHERLVSGRWLMRKSHYRLRFGGMMRWTMMRITIWNGYAQPMSAFSDLSRPRCCRSLNVLLYPPNNKVVWGYFGFTPSVCPSVRPSVPPAVSAL